MQEGGWRAVHDHQEFKGWVLRGEGAVQAQPEQCVDAQFPMRWRLTANFQLRQIQTRGGGAQGGHSHLPAPLRQMMRGIPPILAVVSRSASHPNPLRMGMQSQGQLC